MISLHVGVKQGRNHDISNVVDGHYYHDGEDGIDWKWWWGGKGSGGGGSWLE